MEEVKAQIDALNKEGDGTMVKIKKVVEKEVEEN